MRGGRLFRRESRGRRRLQRPWLLLVPWEDCELLAVELNEWVDLHVRQCGVTGVAQEGELAAVVTPRIHFMTIL